MAAVDPIFPKPTYFGKAKRWKLSDCQKYDAAIAGLPPPEIDQADDRWLTERQVCQRYSVSHMTIWRRTTGAARHGETAA
jgi:predicted DNA-binding transcriptional regulator AlpA